MDEVGAGAAIARRRIASILKDLRDKADVNLEPAAEHIDRAAATLSKMENGKTGVRFRKADITGLCELYGASQETRRLLLTLVEATHVKGWFQPFRDVMPPQFDMYLGLESACASLQVNEMNRIPGLMQTEDYARAIMSLPGADGRARDANEIDRRVAVRMRRKDVITREFQPPRIEVLLDQSILYRPIGGPAIMAEQLHHLNDLGKLPTVSVQVVPYAAGLHQGVTIGKFIILRFPPDSSEPPTVFVDGVIGDLWFKEEKEVELYSSAFADTQGHALDLTSSRKLIEQAAEELTQ